MWSWCIVPCNRSNSLCNRSIILFRVGTLMYSVKENMRTALMYSVTVLEIIVLKLVLSFKYVEC